MLLLMGKGRFFLNAQVVFEIKNSRLKPEARSQFAHRCGGRQNRTVGLRRVDSRYRPRLLPFAFVLRRNGSRETASRAG
jgi:hypothetical protein